MSAPTPAPGDDRPREGYYPDPSIPGYVRYWNGSSWVPGTSRPAPSDGASLSPPDSSVEATGPHFFDEDPVRQYGNGPDPAASWAADPAHQSGFGGDQDRRVSWGAPPEDDGTADAPSDGTFVFRRPTAGDEGASGGQGSAGTGPGGRGEAWGDGQGPVPGAPGFGGQGAAGTGPGAQGAPEASGPGGPGGAGAGGSGVGSGAAPGGPVFGPPAGGGSPAGGSGGGTASAASGPAKPGFAAGKAAAERAAAAQAAQAQAQPQVPAQAQPQVPAPAQGTPGPQGGGYGFPPAAGQASALPGPPQAAPGVPGVPQQFGPAQVPQAPAQAAAQASAQAAAQAAGAPPMAPGPGGGQSSWAQQVHRLAGADESPLPWKPPVDDIFQAAARRQAAARPAGLGKRLAARLVDTVVLAAVTSAAAVPLGVKALDHVNEKIDEAKLSGRTVTVWLLDGTTGVYLGIVLAVLLVFGILYEALPTAKWGRTLGKKLFGLEVRDIEGGEPPSFGAALRRWLVYSVPGLLAIGVVGVVWGLFDRPWRQCWHDKVAHTFVAG
ncbi:MULTISPECIES: RDD family protein [Streptomyces]|uniref:RDD family protein n=2 Tax=Streptomyces TaxID=1883 RepID=A0ABV9IP86_9ACTN